MALLGYEFLISLLPSTQLNLLGVGLAIAFIALPQTTSAKKYFKVRRPRKRGKPTR